MKKAAAILALLTIALTGCAQNQNPMSDAWNENGSLTASDIVSDLVKVGYCQAKDSQTPDPATDYGKAWAADQVRSCNDYAVASAMPGGCQLTYNVSVGKNRLFNPKRPLIYEDSMSVLLLYGQSWQLEMSPARGSADPIETTVGNCKDYVQKLIKTIGGSVNRYGDY